MFFSYNIVDNLYNDIEMIQKIISVLAKEKKFLKKPLNENIEIQVDEIFDQIQNYIAESTTDTPVINDEFHYILLYLIGLYLQLFAIFMKQFDRFIICEKIFFGEYFRHLPFDENQQAILSAFDQDLVKIFGLLNRFDQLPDFITDGWFIKFNLFT